MPKIFISYRRDDSQGYAGRIHERLERAYGTEAVFMDLDDIAPGVDFVRRIEESVGSSDVMLALIGKRWLEAKDDAGRRRIDDPQDFVRAEIASALERSVRIIPVLLNNASMPSEKDLPGPLRRLAHFQAIEVSDERWDYDIKQLEKALESDTDERRKRRFLVKAAAAAASVLIVTLVLYLLLGKQTRPDIAGRWVADLQYDFGARYSEVFAYVIRTPIFAFFSCASRLPESRQLAQISKGPCTPSNKATADRNVIERPQTCTLARGGCSSFCYDDHDKFCLSDISDWLPRGRGPGLRWNTTPE